MLCELADRLGDENGKKKEKDLHLLQDYEGFDSQPPAV